MIAPAIEDLAEEYAGRVIVAKMNTDEHQDWARKLGIRGIPTMIFFNGGEEVDRIVGAVPKNVLQDRMNQLL
jgi:thioredoxin 1